MAQYYSGKEVQQPYDTARESVEALNTTADKGIKQARTSTGNFLNRVKQTASDLVDPHRTVLPTPGMFMYQRDRDGNILYDEDGKPVSVRDYKRAGIKHFAENQNKISDPKSEAVEWFRLAVENPGISDQIRTPLLQASLSMQNAFELEDPDRLTFSKAIEMANNNESYIEDIGQPIDNAVNVFNTTTEGNDVETEQEQPKGVKEVSGTDSLKIGEKGNPWQRKSLMDSPKEANKATEAILKDKGYDLRGLGLTQKQDLFSDYRLGRLQETDKGLFFNNKLIRKR